MKKETLRQLLGKNDPVHLRRFRAASFAAGLSVLAGLHAGPLPLAMKAALVALCLLVAVFYYTSLLGSWRRLSLCSRLGHASGYALYFVLLLSGHSYAPFLHDLRF